MSSGEEVLDVFRDTRGLSRLMASNLRFLEARVIMIGCSCFRKLMKFLDGCDLFWESEDDKDDDLFRICKVG